MSISTYNLVDFRRLMSGIVFLRTKGFGILKVLPSGIGGYTPFKG